jgi:hypothetical protein
MSYDQNCHEETYEKRAKNIEGKSEIESEIKHKLQSTDKDRHFEESFTSRNAGAKVGRRKLSYEQQNSLENHSLAS